MTRAVHQLVPVLARGDAVSGSVLRFRELLRSRGYKSDIYAQLIDGPLRKHALPPESLHSAVGPEDTVIYHLSIGSPLAATFARLPARRAVFYQNVTPADSVDVASPTLAHHLRWGRSDLATLAPIADVTIAPSEFSANELRAAGAQSVAVVPLPPNVQRLHPRPSSPGQVPALLFVGRFAPHKRQDVLIRVLAALRATRAPDARLVLAGAPEIPEYIGALGDFAVELGVGDAVTMHTSHLTDAQLGERYAEASVFVCASEHEGFCVPLLESMAFSVPVIAYAAGAVAETVGRGGAVLNDRDPLLWAELAWRLSTDRVLRDQFAHAGRMRLEDFTDDAIGDRLVAALNPSAGAAASATAR